MKKENILAFIEYGYVPLSKKEIRNDIFLVFWIYGFLAAFISHLLEKYHIMAGCLIGAAAFFMYSVVAVRKYTGDKPAEFFYRGVSMASLSVCVLLFTYLHSFSDAADGNWLLPVLILTGTSAISAAWMLRLVKRNISRGFYNQTASQMCSSTGVGGIFGVLGMIIARTFFHDISQEALALVMMVFAVFLINIFSAVTAVKFYKYYLAKNERTYRN